jgi:DivIVA domain-containing protein
VTQETGPAFLYYRSPASIREVTFSHRMRGLDEDEVYAFLDLLADQVESADTERAALQADNERLRAAQSQDPPAQNPPAQDAPEDGNPQAVALLSQAQEVADRLVEEAVQHARNLIGSACAQQREILQTAHEAAEAALRESTATRADGSATGHTKAVPEVEYARTLARVAQVQLRSVVNALNEVERLGESPRLSTGLRPDAIRPPEIPEQPGSSPAPRTTSDVR